MPNNAKNALVGKPLVTGGTLVAPIGTALPTDETTALNAAFNAVGYLTDDGVTRSESRDSDTKYAWGGDTLAVLQKTYGVEVKFSLAEYLNPLTQSLIYGTANVTTTAATSTVGQKMKVIGTSTPCPHMEWVIEILQGTKRLRVVFPDAQITDTDDVSYTDDDLAARGVTLTLFPDASGAYFYEYSNNGVTTA